MSPTNLKRQVPKMSLFYMGADEALPCMPKLVKEEYRVIQSNQHWQVWSLVLHLHVFKHATKDWTCLLTLLSK